MLHQGTRRIVFLLSTMFIVTAMTGIIHSNSRNAFPPEGTLTECDTEARLSHVCYQCASLYSGDDFRLVYTSCCDNASNGGRAYCEAVYHTPPLVGQ